jgi:phosphomannomutase
VKRFLVIWTENTRKTVLELFDYVFSENGLMAWKHGNHFFQESIKNFLGEDRLKKFLNFTLHYLADIDIPVKRYCTLHALS